MTTAGKSSANSSVCVFFASGCGSAKTLLLSLRWATFGDSLWYADNLAAMARHGYDGLCREDFIGADCKSALCWVVCWLLLDFS